MGRMTSHIWKINNVPNHQPVYIVIEKLLSYTKTVTTSDKVRTIVLTVTLQLRAGAGGIQRLDALVNPKQ